MQRLKYDWSARKIGETWRVVVPVGRSCAGISQSARVAFDRWRGADEARAGLGLHIAHAGYTALESDGRRADTLALTLFRLAPHQIRRRPLKAPPATDAMASVRARRAERAGAVTVDRRRRYDWQPVHGHTVALSTSGPEYRAVQNAAAAWHAWKRARVESGTWTPDEAHSWRMRIAATRSTLRATVIDSRLPPPALAPRAVDIDPDTVGADDW